MAKRRFLSFLLAAALVTSSLPLTAAAADEAAAHTYTEAADFAVSGYEGAVTVVTQKHLKPTSASPDATTVRMAYTTMTHSLLTIRQKPTQ